MAPYVFMERGGIHIIDLNKTVAMVEDAASALKQIAKSKKQCQARESHLWFSEYIMKFLSKNSM